jgi:hypothetical protein
MDKGKVMSVHLSFKIFLLQNRVNIFQLNLILAVSTENELG